MCLVLVLYFIHSKLPGVVRGTEYLLCTVVLAFVPGTLVHVVFRRVPIIFNKNLLDIETNTHHSFYTN